MISKRIKYFFLFSTSVILAVAVLLWYHFSGGYYSSLSVTYSGCDYPLITAELQGRSCMLAVGIGSRFPLFLRQETLDGIDKESQGTAEWYNIEGKRREAPSYLIPQLKVGDLTLKDVVAYQSEDREYGTLGKLLGGGYNLLLDFPNSRIIACDTFSKLQAKKFAGEDWVRVPIETHRIGIIFHVNTDFGTRKLAINTISTMNLLGSSFLPHGKPFASSSFVLGGRQFGNVTFESMDLPEGLSVIDGFIGMDFLKEHAIYLDYTHKVAYVEPPKKYFEAIPVTLDDRIDPIIDVSIQGNVYPLRLDLGSSCSFSLREEILQNIRKTKRGTYKWYDFRGKQYESPVYTIPEIKIGNLIFASALAKRDNEDFNVGVVLSGSPLQLPGVIGLPILEKYNLFLDFPHATIYASNDHWSLQKAGLLSKNLLAIPFTLHPDGILLAVETDAGTYRLMLDTGSTSTAIRAPHPAFTKKFRIMGHDFGKYFIRAIDVNPQFDFDGFLGMDFLREFPLFIDYSNKIIFIDLQKDGSQAYSSSKEVL
jgi:hypothetical protein